MGINSGFKGLIYLKRVFPALLLCLMGKCRVAAPFFVDCVRNVMAHVQKPDFVFGRNGRVHLNQRGRQSTRLLAAEVCTLAVVMVKAS